MSSLRLKKIYDLIDKNSIVADIGTDHGIIPIMLSKSFISKKIIATDISKNSLEKLKKKLIFNENILNIETRVSDGLDCLFEFEVDTIVISGMGGILIRDILEKNLKIAKSANSLILAPNNSLDILRKFLYKNNFYIEKEIDVFENQKYYQIMKVKRGKDFYKEEYEYLYGKDLIKTKSVNLKLFLENEIIKFENIISTLNIKSKYNNRIFELNEYIDKIRRILSEF